jgi:hypothetical protein
MRRPHRLVIRSMMPLPRALMPAAWAAALPVALATTLVPALAAVVAAPTVATAQVGNPLPRAAGMGGNFTALARGLGAAPWNPAGLGMPDNPRVSFTLLPVAATAGLSPVTLGDVAAHDGQLIPHDTRVRWLELIQAHGGQAGSAGTDVTYLAFSVGRIAVSASSGIRGSMNLGPDAAELILFGNAGLTGDPRDYTLHDSTIDLMGTTTLAASGGFPLRLSLGPLPDQHFALGATVKYTMGNFLVMAEEQGSTVGTDPLEVHIQFPMIHTHFPEDDEEVAFRERMNNGGGFGLDVGAAWQAGMFSAGVAIRNLVSTFEWDVDALRYRAGATSWTADSSWTSFQEEPFEHAPAALVDRLDQLYTFPPVLAAGAAARVLPFLTLSGEMRHALEDHLDAGARSHLGVGGELTIIPFVPLRAGLAMIPGGYQLSGGLGLRVGGMQLAASSAYRQAELGSDVMAAMALTYGLR